MRESRSYDPELYRKVKESVTMQQAVEYCGLRVIKDKCLCPFHKDQHPSMKIYPDGKGYLFNVTMPGYNTVFLFWYAILYFNELAAGK